MDSNATNYMQMALDEAVHAIGVSRPNPAVGAVVVKDGVVVGRGRTQRPGSAHAEVMALRDAGELARGAAIFVTLEPCCHYGRTPPCTKALIDAGISQVFFAHADPNPVVRGNSRRILEEAGIEVFEGVDACAAAEISEGLREDAGRAVFHRVERYFEAYDYFVRTKQTFVEVKCAVSQEGFMGGVAADGSRKSLRITGDGANCWNHELRAMSDAVLVGAGTVLADNPSLDVRFTHGNNPVKIVWAGHREFSAEEVARLKVFACDVTLVYTCIPQPALASFETVILPHATFAENWRFMLTDLSARGMHRLMVEPGAGLASQLFFVENPCDGAFNSDARPLWNRLDLWQSTDIAIDDALERQVESGTMRDGLNFPGLPNGAVARESAMIGLDVLTVYYR